MKIYLFSKIEWRVLKSRIFMNQIILLVSKMLASKTKCAGYIRRQN